MSDTTHFCTTWSRSAGPYRVLRGSGQDRADKKLSASSPNGESQDTLADNFSPAQDRDQAWQARRDPRRISKTYVGIKAQPGLDTNSNRQRPNAYVLQKVVMDRDNSFVISVRPGVRARSRGTEGRLRTQRGMG